MAKPDTYHRMRDAAIAVLAALDSYEFDHATSRLIEQLREAATAEPGRPRSDLTPETTKQLLAEGKSKEEIAKQYNCTVRTVDRRLSQA